VQCSIITGAGSLTLVQVPASAIISAGQVSLSLTNPGANGGTSCSVAFLVHAKTTFPFEESQATPARLRREAEVARIPPFPLGCES